MDHRENAGKKTSQLTICFSAPEPLLYVEERVEEQSSAYHGNWLF